MSVLPDWEQQEQDEHQQWLTEHCEHGEHKDSGHPCPLCAVESHPDPDPKGWGPSYEAWSASLGAT